MYVTLAFVYQLYKQHTYQGLSVIIRSYLILMVHMLKHLSYYLYWEYRFRQVVYCYEYGSILPSARGVKSAVTTSAV